MSPAAIANEERDGPAEQPDAIARYGNPRQFKGVGMPLPKARTQIGE